MCLAGLCSGGLEEKPHRYHRQSEDQPLAVAAVESGGQLEVDWKMLFSETRIAEALPFPVQPQGAEHAQNRSRETEIRNHTEVQTILAFQPTTSSSPSSSVEGSGMGPSITHLFDSYLVRMKFSILASEGI